MTFNLTKMKKGLGVGQVLDVPMSPSSRGQYVHDLLSSIYGGDNSKGVDNPQLGVEYKTASEKTKDHTIGVMSRQKVISTPYDRSHIFKKLKKQYRVKMNDGLGTVVSEKLYDFNDPHLHDLLRHNYEYGRSLIACGKYVVNRRIKHKDGYGWWEPKTNDTFAFRITDEDMIHMEHWVDSQSVRGQLLSW